jgi:hypothetical protein
LWFSVFSHAIKYVKQVLSHSALIPTLCQIFGTLYNPNTRHSLHNMGFHKKEWTLNANNIGLVRYTVYIVYNCKSGNTGFHHSIIFSSFTRCPHLLMAQSQNVSVSICRWRRCTLLIMFMDKKKRNVSCGHTAHVKFLYCFKLNKTCFVLFP